MKRSIAMYALLLPGTVFAGDPILHMSTTMCQAGEDVYISCSFDNNSEPDKYFGPAASICAKNNTSPDHGYVQYRYGTPPDSGQHNISLEFPRHKVPPKNMFRIYTPDTTPKPGSFMTVLQFNIGGYEYAFENHVPDGYWVTVKKDSTYLFKKQCTDPGKLYLTDKAYKGIREVSVKPERHPDNQ